jgi:hypothetical protein
MRHFLSRKFDKLVIMKTAVQSKKLPKGFKIDPNLADRYASEPLFEKKAEKANATLKAVGVPKGW